MLTYIRRFLSPPVFDSEERTLEARMLVRVALATAGMATLFLGVLILIEPSTLGRRAGSIVFVMAASAGAIALGHRGRTRAGSWILVLCLVAVLTVRAIDAGGLSAPTLNGYVIIVLIGGMLLGTRAGVAVAVLCLLSGLAMAIAERLGLTPPPVLEFTPLTAWLYLGLWLALAVVIQGQVGWTLRHALRRAAAELAEREAAQRDLKDAFARLQESEERFGRLFGAVPSGLIATRVEDGVIVQVNEAFERVSGWSRTEAQGHSTLSLGIWPDRSNREAFVDAVRGAPDHVVVMDLPLRIRDGRERLMRVSTVVVELRGEQVLLSEVADVTGQRATEAALRLSERRFAAIFQEVPVALAASEVATGRLLEVNAAFLKLVAAPSPSTVLGKNLVELGVVSQELRSRVVEFVQSGRSGKLIVPGRRLNGEEFIGESSYASYMLDGKLLMISCTVDVSDRVRAEEELLRAERQYRDLVNGVEDVVFSLAPDGTISTLSAAFERITGMAPAPWIGKPFQELLHPDDAARAQQEVALSENAGPSENPPLRIRGADGQHRLAEIRLAPRHEDGQLTSIFGIGRDVTERVALEAAHRQAEKERETTLHELGERVKELRLLHQTARLLQTSTQGLEELFAEWIRLVPAALCFPECCEARISFGHIVAATPGWRESPWRLASPILTAEGSGVLEVVYLEERPNADEGPFFAEERSLVDSLVEMLVRYIEVRRYREGLEGLVERRTRELRAARDEADRANRAKSTFLATMSHEIRTPMNAVLGNTQLLRRDRSLTPGQRTKVDVILSSGNHLLTLLNNVLDMSRVEAGHSTINLQVVDLRVLLRDVEHMFAAMAATKGLSLAFESTGDVPRTISTDAGKVRQVLVNLIGNALKFTTQGGIVIRTSSERTAEAGVRIAIEVRDSGPGISAEDLPRVFGAFEQTGLGAQVGGTGLGLAISHEFAKLLGGDLTATSTVGVGSAFRFTLLAQEVSSEAARAAAEHRSPVRLAPGEPTRRLLVVDDVAEGRDVVAELLAGVGFDVRAVESGEAALLVHDAWRPDLVLMDLRMPGIGGVEAIRRLRQAESTAVLIAFTANSIDAADAEVRRAGADDLILKPYSDSELLGAIGRYLKVRYIYDESRPPALTPVTGVAARVPLAAMLSRVPPTLREELRLAVLSARTAKIEELATAIAGVSPDAAEAVRDLALTFKYDRILSAIDATGGIDD